MKRNESKRDEKKTKNDMKRNASKKREENTKRDTKQALRGERWVATPTKVLDFVKLILRPKRLQKAMIIEENGLHMLNVFCLYLVRLKVDRQLHVDPIFFFDRVYFEQKLPVLISGNRGCFSGIPPHVTNGGAVWCVGCLPLAFELPQCLTRSQWRRSTLREALWAEFWVPLCVAFSDVLRYCFVSSAQRPATKTEVVTLRGFVSCLVFLLICTSCVGFVSCLRLGARGLAQWLAPRVEWRNRRLSIRSFSFGRVRVQSALWFGFPTRVTLFCVESFGVPYRARRSC